MLRLLFCSAALLPIAVIPWMTSDADAIEPAAVETTYAEAVRDPSLQALRECETEDVPVYFHDSYLATHSAEFVHDSLVAADGCGELDVVIIPILPEDAESHDIVESVERTAELREMVRQSGADVTVATATTREANSALYVNGRAAILRIEPDSATD